MHRLIRVTEKLWVGNSYDEQFADAQAVLNVAMDLKPTRGWPQVEYAQVGLIDGPGNDLRAYVAATMTLLSLLTRYNQVLVNCHKGQSRSMSVAIMAMHVDTGAGWEELLARVRERNDKEVPEPHEAHRVAFNTIDWKALRGIFKEWQIA